MAIQYNTKALKDFRDTLALWHIADFKLADELLQKQKRVNAIKVLIESDEKLIEQINNGDKVHTNYTIEDLQTRIDENKAIIEREDKAMAKIREEQNKDLNKGRELITDELVKSVTEYMDNIYDSDKDIKGAFVEWLKHNGAKGVSDTDVIPFVKAIGVKKASTRVKAKSGKHNATISKIALKDIILGVICDEPNMKKALPIYKWVTIIESKKTNNK